jgi:hypothetical protein
MFQKAGFVNKIGAKESQSSRTLYLFAPQQQVIRKKNKEVVVVSFYNASNFGDRLGYHLIPKLLPSHANVKFLGLYQLEEFKDLNPDLLILGMGNSIFCNCMTKELMQLVKRSKKSIGIFGFQYKEQINKEYLNELIDSLDAWYARYEEDILMYGKDKKNVFHLGDFLISLFPMVTPIIKNEKIIIKRQTPECISLDRMIQQVQRYSRVHSERLHLLLCALTSAEFVSYEEQFRGDIKSGKFRSLLLDIFNFHYEENVVWKVNKSLVRDYKNKVELNMQKLKKDIELLLD